MTRTCEACHTATLTLDEHATRGSPYEHYRCQNPDCRAGGIQNPRTGRRVGPVFEGRTPLASRIASQTTATTTTMEIQS